MNRRTGFSGSQAVAFAASSGREQAWDNYSGAASLWKR